MQIAKRAANTDFLPLIRCISLRKGLQMPRTRRGRLNDSENDSLKQHEQHAFAFKNPLPF